MALIILNIVGALLVVVTIVGGLVVSVGMDLLERHQAARIAARAEARQRTVPRPAHRVAATTAT